MKYNFLQIRFKRCRWKHIELWAENFSNQAFTFDLAQLCFNTARQLQGVNSVNKLFRIIQRFFGQYKSFIALRWQSHTSQAIITHRRKPHGMKKLTFLQNKCHVAVRYVSHQFVFVCACLIKRSAVMHRNAAAIKPAAIFIPHLTCFGF